MSAQIVESIPEELLIFPPTLLTNNNSVNGHIFGILSHTQTWSLANYTLLPQIVKNMFQEHLEDLRGQNWVIEEIDIKKEGFCHRWPLQISIAMVIKVLSPSNK